MKIIYYCHNCGDFIDELSVDRLEEEKLGFDILTQEEKKDIIKWSKSGDMLYVRTIGDSCHLHLNDLLAEEIGIQEESKLYDKCDLPLLH